MTAEKPRGTLDAVLTLVCRSCTRQMVYSGPDQMIARLASVADGWKERGGRAICPKCP